VLTGSSLSDMVTIPLRVTRLQYAKIMYQTFHIPKKFHTVMRIIGDADSILFNKSFELGCRLTCGTFMYAFMFIYVCI
jgi:hypothetical protein